MSDITIEARDNGPYLITGPVRVFDQSGAEFERPAGSAIALCRCGQSSNKPFCDGTHKNVGFVGDDPAPRVSS